MKKKLTTLFTSILLLFGAVLFAPTANAKAPVSDRQAAAKLVAAPLDPPPRACSGVHIEHPSSTKTRIWVDTGWFASLTPGDGVMIVRQYQGGTGVYISEQSVYVGHTQGYDKNLDITSDKRVGIQINDANTGQKLCLS